MIWAEFEDENGKVIGLEMVVREGIARKWIVNNDLRSYHQQRITVGTKGYFKEGIRTAECEVIEIVGLMSNPVGTNKV